MNENIIESIDSSGFVILSEVIPDIINEIRYYTSYNFVGERIDGYEEPIALLTKEAAGALKKVNDELIKHGYRIKIFDAYRPTRAVKHFMKWSKDKNDDKMREFFYPDLDKASIFESGYLAKNSPHSRGSTVDITLFDMKLGKDVDMGSPFDFLGDISHPDSSKVTKKQHENRMFLKDIMTSNGFKSIKSEWWHFVLENEPYPNTYFDFPVNSNSIKKTRNI